MPQDRAVTTGFEGLDKILDALRLGDNVVWKVDRVADYRYVARPFAAAAMAEGRRVVYLRFGQHEPILDEPGLQSVTYEINPRDGFEPFASSIHAILAKEGRGVFYVFDCLSELLSAWATDHMIANFFRVTCPYLFELDTVAYFALIRERHAFRTIHHIRETTQLLLDLYHHAGETYVQPLKVWERHSPTMFLPHRQVGENFVPLATSYQATELMSEIYRRDGASASRQLDHWHRLFLQAEELAAGPPDETLCRPMVEHISRHIIGRDPRILELALRHFSLDDLLAIKARMIGTGYIGGKAVGMLLARKILLNSGSDDWARLLEEHDSFYVGSNAFYSFLVHNDWWRLYMEQKTSAGYFEAAAELRQQMLAGRFPDSIRDGFRKMLEYFGQYPIIVRSSSLLEDGFGNAFAGKYDSFFCANQGSPEQRLEVFEDAVRRIYASTMSEDALSYRLQRGLDQQDEQMGLLIQRVSGSYRRQNYYPDLAGVGVSYNTFAWDRELDPEAGMLRLVYGLGTRAVNRVEGDYPCIIALDHPLKRPHKGGEDVRRFTQRDVDLVDVADNRLRTLPFQGLVDDGSVTDPSRFAVRDEEAMGRLAERGRKKQEIWLLSFRRLLAETDFPKRMQTMLKTIEQAYSYPVDIEFAVNFTPDGESRINLLQCRPLQTRGTRRKVEIPRQVAEERVFFRSEGHFMGGNIQQTVKRVIWIDPQGYLALSQQDKYETARIIGRLNKRIASRRKNPTLLLGPGRWGTSTPTLGVPVNFAEINNFAAIGEVAFSSGGLMPELSYGSHFFQDLVEADIFYLALFPESGSCLLNARWMDHQPNVFEALMPTCGRFKKVIRVFNCSEAPLTLAADIVSQQLVCYQDPAKKGD